MNADAFSGLYDLCAATATAQYGQSKRNRKKLDLAKRVPQVNRFMKACTKPNSLEHSEIWAGYGIAKSVVVVVVVVVEPPNRDDESTIIKTTR